MATTANLLRLPPELMCRICSSSNLTTHELACFRLTCKQVETNLFESFAREFFTKRQFMLEEVSIEALVGIANHKTLAPYLKEVIISNEKLPDLRASSHINSNDPGAFITTGHAHIMLADAFAKLRNLKTIGIRDYDGKGRWRDGSAALWRSYGWSSVGNSDPSSRPFRPRMNTELVLPLLLYSLDKASTGLERIEVFLRRNRLSDASFDLSPSFMQTNAVPVLSNLKTLLLSLQTCEARTHANMYFPVGGGPTVDDNALFRNLKDFLGHTPLLEHLRLNFNGTERPSSCATELLAWLGTSPGSAVKKTPAPINLDHLTALDLGMVHVEAHILLNIVSKFAKLEALSLWKVVLQDTQKDPDYSERDSGCLWSYYLRKLGQAFQAPEDVKTLMLGWLAEGVTAYGAPRQTRFAGKTNVDGNGIKTFEDVEDVVKYRKRVGSNACEWLEELGDKAFSPTVEMYSSDNSDEDDEGDEGDEGDSDDSAAVRLQVISDDEDDNDDDEDE